MSAFAAHTETAKSGTLTALRPRPGLLSRRAESPARWGTDLRGGAMTGIDLTEGGAPQGVEVLRQCEGSDRFLKITRGWAGIYHLLEDGRRRLIGFGLEGDLVGLCLRPQTERNYGVLALTPLRYESGRNAQLVEAMRRAPALGLRVAAEMEARSQEMSRNFVVMASRTAEERICHALLCLALRQLNRAPRTGDRLSVPLTQQQLGEATGLSYVHVNRVLQALRRERVLQFQSGILTLRDVETLTALAHLDPLDYLNAVVRFAENA